MRTLLAFLCRGLGGGFAAGAVLLALPGIIRPGRAETPGASEAAVARFGYSRALMRGVNESDFRSAMSIYVRLICQTYQIPAAPDIALLTSNEEIATALGNGSVNIVAASAEEILALPGDLTEPRRFTATTNGELGAEYVLLAPSETGVAGLADLRGKNINVLDNVHGVLGPAWLAVALADAGLGSPAEFFHEIRLTTKPALAALPVFFRQADACVITRAAFLALGELNPQVPRRLRVIATSPRVLPTMMAFRRGIDPQLFERVLHAMSSVKGTAAGRQMLTIFQTEDVAFCDPTTLEATRQLLAARARLAAPSPETIARRIP